MASPFKPMRFIIIKDKWINNLIVSKLYNISLIILYGHRYCAKFDSTLIFPGLFQVSVLYSRGSQVGRGGAA